MESFYTKILMKVIWHFYEHYHDAVHAGSVLDIWTGCYSSPFEPVALLACVAINGYHGTSSYTWKRGVTILPSHQTPLLYCVTTGSYTCNVSCEGFNMSCMFWIEGIVHLSQS